MLDFTGQFNGIQHNYLTGETSIIFTVNEDIVEQLDEIRDVEKLAISVKKWREKRSLNANAYFHVLNNQIAKMLNISTPRCKNLLIHKYGQPLMIDGVHAVIKSNIDPDYMLEQEHLHVWVAKGGDDKTTFYFVYRPTHEYDRAEMQTLIAGTVDDAQTLGIQTLPSKELQTLCENWENAK